MTDETAANRLLTPGFPDAANPLRYYQENAINQALEAILTGRRRALLTLCTGAGKTAVAFQIAWRLWNSGWNKRGDFRKPKLPPAPQPRVPRGATTPPPTRDGRDVDSER